jgi:hypothetical protein
MLEVQYNKMQVIALDKGDGTQAFSIVEDGMVGSALTVKQPYASMLVYGSKKFEYRSWKLPEDMTGEIIYIHAGAMVLKEKVNVSDELYESTLEDVERENLQGCIVGCVVFGKPEKTATGYAWPVIDFIKLEEPIRNVKGHLGIWKFKVRKESDK